MKKVVTMIAGLLVIGILPAAIYLVNTRQDIRKKAAPATTLAITPASLAKKIDDTFSMEVVIDTGENQVVAAELHVTFDPTKLEAQTIANGTLLPNILASGSVEAGAATITVGAKDTKAPLKGSGTIALLRLKALAKTDSPTAIKLASNTFVGGLGEGASNVLVGTTPATVTITEDVQAATPPAEQDLAPQGTPLPALTPTPPSTPSASLSIVSPTNEETTTEDTPTIRGKAAPNATITLTIYSSPRTVTVTSDGSGTWSYTPDTPLEAGPHNIVASVTDSSGQTQTATSAFVVASETLAGNPVPVSGTVGTTLFLIVVGMTLITVGIFIPKSLWLFR